jgi:hypothetical protein
MSLRALPAFVLGFLALTLAGCAGGNFGELVLSGPGGICGLIILIADVWAFVKIANSAEDTVTKLLWAALVFFFPVGGLLIWYFFGPKG